MLTASLTKPHPPRTAHHPVEITTAQAPRRWPDDHDLQRLADDGGPPDPPRWRDAPDNPARRA
jgi:hypothetical protein